MPARESRDHSRFFWSVIGVLTLIFVVHAPFLSRMDFVGTVEPLNVATAMEIRRSGHWFVPTLDGVSRVRKPPLMAWVTALSLRPETLGALVEADPTVRAAARQALHWEARVPALAMACLSLLALYDFASSILISRRSAYHAVLIASTSGLLLYCIRAATTDIPLLLFTTVALATVARMSLNGPTWLNTLVMGLSAGLGLLSKGPVAILLTLVPGAAAVVFTRARIRDQVIHFSAATVLGIAVATPWVIAAASHSSEAWTQWYQDITRTDSSERGTTYWYSYIRFLPLMLPWSLLLLAGVWSVIRCDEPDETTQALRRRIVLPLLCVLLPLIVMSCFRDRKDRYLLPLVMPAAVVASFGYDRLLELLTRRKISGWPVLLHYGCVAVILIVPPLIFVSRRVADLTTIDGEPVLSKSLTMLWLSGATFTALAVAVFANAKQLVLATACVASVQAVIFLLASLPTREANAEMREMAELILQREPARRIVQFDPPPNRKEPPASLNIYLNTSKTRVAGAATPSLPAGGVTVVMQPSDVKGTALLEGWTEVGRVHRGEDWWIAYRLPELPATKTQSSVSKETGYATSR